MSEESKKAADTVRRRLGDASEYIDAAKEAAGRTGDNELQRKVEKLGADTSTIKKDLDEKLSGPQKKG